MTNAGTVNADGVDLRYLREGEGPPVLVIGSATYYPRAFSPSLREHFELVFVDSRHFVPSYQPTDEELQELTLATFADDLEAIRTHLGIEEWTVLGHSIHAQIALAYANKYPERTSNLVLVAGVPFSFEELRERQEVFWNEHASPERKERHAANRKNIESALAAASEERRFAVDYIGNAAQFWSDPTYDSTPLWEGVETGPAFGRLTEVVLSRAEARSALESIEGPTLLILGRLDFAIPHGAWEGLIQDLPSLTYVLLAEDSHNPQTEAPERFDRQLTNWLDGNGSTQQDSKAIREMLREWVRASEAGDAEAYGEFLTDDFIFLGPGAPPVVGKDAVVPWVAGFFADFDFLFPEWLTDEIVVSGDIAIHRYSGVATLKPRAGGASTVLDRKYLDVLRKGADGRWRVSRHMFNLN